MIEDIVSDACQTPSWCNTQPWHVHVPDAAQTRAFADALTAHVLADPEAAAPDIPFPASYEGVYAERRRESGRQLYEVVGVQRGDRETSTRLMMRNFELFQAPHVAILTTDRSLGIYGAVDCGLFLQSFLLAAQSRGVATVAQAAIASRSPFVREWFGLPHDRLVLCGISFGYSDDTHPSAGFRTSRQAMADALTWIVRRPGR